MTYPNDLIRDLLTFLGETRREGLEETPARVIKAWQFWTDGYGKDPIDVLKCFEDGAEKYDEMIFQGAIPCFSNCEHHMTPFFGFTHIGYIPNGRIIGLSKFSRLVDIFARRLQVQERLTQQIAHALDDYLKPVGVGVVLRCRHMCMESRGIQKPGTVTYTSSLLGAMRDGAARAEFLQFVERADAATTI